MALMKLAEMYTSRSHVLNCELYKMLEMKVDEIHSALSEDEDAEAMRAKIKRLQVRLAFSEDARTRATYDVTKAQTIQKACIVAQKKAESQLKSCQSMIQAKDRELTEVLNELTKAKSLLDKLGVPGQEIPAHCGQEIRSVLNQSTLQWAGDQFVGVSDCFVAAWSTEEDETSSQKDARGKQKTSKNITYNVPDHLLPRVAIVGRPNVGKSALFNRLVGGNRAIVVDEPGVTRDRLYGRSFWGDYEFMVVDTGGVLTISKSQTNMMEELAISTTIGMEGIPLASREAAVARMPSMIEKQATIAVEESSVIIFLVDGQTENHDEEDYVPAIAIVGRPNVGKSSILNALVGEDRTIVSPVSGTTRDAIDTEFTGSDGQKFRLIDTAGIRRRAAVASSGSTTEALSVNRAFRAIRRSDVVALVIEAMACITEQVIQA
ncbi:GTP-binding protein EngA [Forsythia ovata]|uniref:GTP-binding protein EngA n=1 Tax=Forsythia ovata TaxID=205694 RepID=A0ABD1VG63_9LAMI